MYSDGQSPACATRRPHAGLREQFPLGAKIDVDQVYFDTGGGATNAAVTFARQGLGVATLAKSAMTGRS
jgi:hypothetical protein